MKSMHLSRTYLIAGAGTAFGLSLSRSLFREGANLILLDRHLQLERTFGEKQSFADEDIKSRILFFRIDASRASWLKPMMRQAAERFAAIDGVVSISDFIRSTSIRSLSHHQFQQHLKRNLFAPAAIVHAAIPYCSANATILLVAPEAENLPAASASFEGLKGLSRALQSELGKEGKRVHFLSCEPQAKHPEAHHSLRSGDPLPSALALLSGAS